MPEQKKKTTPESTKVESPKIPNVAYPLKPRSNTTNLSQQYFNHLAGDESARFLFNNSGLWHQGIHLRASKFPSSEFENNKICAIADGKLIAYKVDREYKTDAKSESSKASAVYSTGFFLLKHEVAYPKDNVLTFYSLYRHTAKLSDYKSGIEEIVGITKSADNKIVIRDAKNQPLNPRIELKNDVTIGVRRNTKGQEQFDELLWYRETQGNKTIPRSPKAGEHWRIFRQSYVVGQSEQIKGLPLLSKHKIDTQADVEVKLNKAIAVKAGEELGLMGEYNQIGESGEKLLHLEVFTYDNIEQFKAKAEAAYKQDREKKGIKANFLYVARGSQLYSIANDEAVALEKSQVEIMVPLADVAKKTVKKKTDKTGKDYYNVQPYLYSLPQKNKDGGIYVDSSHLTHGLLFPGVNIFNQSGNGLCIFKHPLHQNIDPKSDLTTEQKNELDPVFKSIMNELSLDKDKNKPVVFEAGKLKDLLLTSVQQRRLTGIVVKHDSEWKKTRTADFSQTCGVYRANGKEDTAKRIEKRIADLSIKLEVDGFNTDKQAYYLHPLGMIGWLAVAGCQCGQKLINAIKCTRYKTKVRTQYGPVYKGNQPLSSYAHWNRLISEGKVSQDESRILIAMSANEGNLDAVQSYDSEILTAGASQKTINSLGAGELPTQMNKFKEQFPQLFDKYFKCCGWDVRLKSGDYVAYYNDVTGAELKNIIRNGYTADTYGKFVPNKAVAIFAEAIDTDEYKELQVLDFIDRLRLALNIIPKGYSYQIASYVKSNLGKATVLDHHVNRPNNVSKYFGIALDSFFSKNPNVSKNPNTWGALHNKYEKEIIDYYGVNRDGTDMPTRYMELKKKL